MSPESPFPRIAHAHDRASLVAAQTGTSLASQPSLRIHHDAPPSLRELSVENIVDFAADRHGASPDLLSGMAFDFRPLPKGTLGELSLDPLELNGALHFPVITIDPFMRAERLNRTLLHELRHVFQANRTEAYNNEDVVRYIQTFMAAKAIGMFTEAAPYIMSGHSSVQVIGGLMLLAGGCVVGAGTAPSIAKRLAWLTEPLELDAELFSWRNRSYRPIATV